MLRFEQSKLTFNFEQFLVTRKKKTVEVNMQSIKDLHKTMDITNYLHPSKGYKLVGHALNSAMPRLHKHPC